MKKIILLAFCALAIVSCKKDNDTELPTPMVTISFDQRIVSGNSMVRSASNDFLDIIESHTPKGVTVTLKNTDLNKTYTCESTETITIPVGNYEISAVSHSGQEVGNVGKYFYTRPSVGLSKTNIQISPSTQTLTLNLVFTCYAIFALIDECSACYMYLWSEYGNFPKVNKYYVAYAKSDLKVALQPYENSTEFTSTVIPFVTTYDATNVFAEFGKYYVVHPQKVETSTSSFDVQFPTMQEGEI